MQDLKKHKIRKQKRMKSRKMRKPTENQEKNTRKKEKRKNPKGENMRNIRLVKLTSTFHSFLLLFACWLVWDSISCKPGWPWIHSIAEDDLELLFLLLPTPPAGLLCLVRTTYRDHVLIPPHTERHFVMIKVTIQIEYIIKFYILQSNNCHKAGTFND